MNLSGRNSIRRLLLIRLLIVIVPLLLAQAWIHLRQYHAQIAEVYRTNLEVARAVADTFESFIEEVRHDALALGESFLLPPKLTPDQAELLLRRTADRFESMRSFSWISPEGRVVASSLPALTGRDVSREPWFQEILAGRAWTLSEVSRARAARARTFRVAQSLRDEQGRLLGVVEASLYAERLTERITLQRLEGRTYAVIDPSGWLVYRYPPGEVSWEDSDWGQLYPQVRAAIAGEEVTARIRDRFDGQVRLSAFVPISDWGWAARASSLEFEVLAPIRRNLLRDGAVVLAVALLAFAVANAAARRITQPLAQLGRHAAQVGAGRFDLQADITGPAELASLARAFNRMTEEVQSREDEHARVLELERARGSDARLLEAVQEHTMTLLAYLDPELRFRHANTHFCQFLGHPCESLIGRRYDEVSKSKVDLELLARARDTGQPVYLREVFRPAAEPPEAGAGFWDISIIPVKDDAGAVEGLVVSMVEVTDRVKAREERVEMERARAEMAETIAAETNHRMKNNLLLLSGVLQLQLSTLPRDSEAAAQLGNAISRITALSTVHEQLYQGHPGRVELGDVLRRLVELGVKALSPGAVEVSVEADPVYTSPKIGSLLAMVANELLTNAIKHGAPSAAGPAEIKVSLKPEEGWVRLSIWNSGNPIPEDFDPAQQEGLGLRLATGLIREQLGGTVTLRRHAGGTLAEVLVAESAIGNDAAT